MNDLKSRIQKASEFLDKSVQKMLNECLENRSGFSHEQEQGIKIGSQWQHSQMQWLAEALEIAVEALVYYANKPESFDVKNKMNYCDDDCPPECESHTYYTQTKARPIAHSLTIAQQALAKVEARLKQTHGAEG